MSTPLTPIKETLEIMILKIKEMEGVPEAERRSLLTRLQKASNTVTENEKKIWLRTKVGNPMVQSFQDSTDKMLSMFDVETPKLEDLASAMNEVETNANKIVEETSRRSMVVT